MKKIVKLVKACLLAMFIFVNPVISQNESSQLSIDRRIRLFGDSAQEEITVKIDKKTDRFSLSINSHIEAGKLTIEIYDSHNEKRGNFSVGSQIGADQSAKDKTKGKREDVRGQINKSVREPISGNWKIKIIPIKAKGIISIKTQQLSEQTPKN